MGALGHHPAAGRRSATLSARSSSSGLVVQTTVARPARAAARPSAMRASVWASTALVGSTRISTSGSATRALARTQSLALAAGERPPALGDLGGQPVGQRLDDVARPRRWRTAASTRSARRRRRSGRARRPGAR